MKVPTSSASSELVVRRSRFIGGARYCDNPDAVKGIVGEIRELHGGCNHVVYAFITGPAGEVSGMSDDGEPKGTAGRPALEVLKGTGLTNTLVTVVRYFGGTKLGTGGLVRAYTESARTALALLDTEELIEKLRFAVVLPYRLYDPAGRLLQSLSGAVLHEDFAEQVTLQGELPAERRAELEKELADLSGGSVAPCFFEPSDGAGSGESAG